MVDVFDEVEEELRKERYQQLLRTYGPWLLGAAVAIVVGVAGYQWWQARQSSQAAESSDRYVAAVELIEAGDVDAARAALSEIAADGPRGYATLALMREAELALQRGEPEAAASLYERAIERAPDPVVADVARYHAVRAQFDTISFDDAVLRLDDVGGAGSQLDLMARELIGAKAIAEARWEEARRRYDSLAVALDLPQGMRQRVSHALALIEQNAPAPVAEAAAETEPPAPPAAAAAPQTGAQSVFPAEGDAAPADLNDQEDGS